MRSLRLGNRNCVSFLIFKWCLSFQGQWDLQSQKAEPYIMNLKMLLKTFFFWLPHGGKSSREQYFSNSLPNRMQEVLSSCGSPQASDQQHKHTQYLRSKSRQVYLTNPHKAKNQIDNNKRGRKIKTNQPINSFSQVRYADESLLTSSGKSSFCLILSSY